jgi:hypothetical protein
MRIRSAASVVATIAVVVVMSCKPKPGESCKEDSTSCSSPTSHLVCSGGVYVAETCKGPKGCAEVEGKVACDSSRADLGDPCVNINALICSTDQKTQLKCEGGKLAYFTRCGGVELCTSNEKGEAFCSHPYGEVGDPCKEYGACTDDQKAELVCVGGKLANGNPCRGEEKCTPRSAGPVCDRSVANIGDACDEKNPELAVACTDAKDTILVCKNGKLVQGPKCGGEGHCGVARYGKDGRRHFQAECDQSLAEIGDDCLKDLAPACSTDLKSKLMCQAGKFVLDKPCKKGCEVNSVPVKFECKDK